MTIRSFFGHGAVGVDQEFDGREDGKHFPTRDEPHGRQGWCGALKEIIGFRDEGLVSLVFGAWKVWRFPDIGVRSGILYIEDPTPTVQFRC